MRRAPGRVSGWLVLSFRDRVLSDVTSTDHRFKLKQNMRQRPCAQDILKIEHRHPETIIVCYTCVVFACPHYLAGARHIYVYNNFPFAIIEINHLDICSLSEKTILEICVFSQSKYVLDRLFAKLFCTYGGGGIKVSLWPDNFSNFS